jgi:hypothetical protein
MASFRRIAIALTIIAAAGGATLSDAAAQAPFNRCPKPEQYGEAMKQLAAAADRSRSMAEENPLLLADVGFYQAELAATRRCAPTVAVMTRPAR